MPFNVVARVKNMTRETKLGLVVSCSFLGLLGVVLALKMTERPEAEQEAEVAAAEPNEAPPPSPTQAAPAVAKETGPPQEAPGLLSFNDPNVLPVSGPVPPDAPPVKKRGEKTAPAGNADPIIPTPSGLPSLPAPVVAKGGDTGKSGTSGVTAPPIPPAVLTRTAPYGLWDAVLLAARTKKTAAPTGTAAVAPPLPPVPPVAPPDGPKLADAPLPPAPGSKEKTDDPMTVAALGKAGDVTGGTKGGTAGGATLPPPPPLPAQKNTPPSLPDLPPVGGSGNTGGAAPPRLVPIPAAPPVALAKGSWLVPTARPAVQGKKEGVVPPPPPPDLPPVAVAGTNGATGTGGAGKQQDSIPTIDVQGIDTGTTGGKPIKVGALPPPETKPPVEPRPAPAPAKGIEPIVVGVRPTASVPPLSLPPAPAVRAVQPDVVSYTEESYVARAGDSFQTISKAKYGTDAYAQALYLFNRSHPLAEDDLLQSDSLKAKQTVYVPPAQILESRYAGAINDVKSPGKSGVTVGTTSQRADAPPAGSRTYRVAAGGEKVYDVARNLLGDGNRWVEIQKLNPGWNWEVPLPPGAAIQVPADARLP